MKYDSIGFIGAGSIARTMIAGLVSKGVTDRKRIWVTNRQNRESLQKLREEFGVNFTYSKKELLENAGIIIIAVKPSDITTVLEEIKPVVDESQLLISVAAGVTTQSIEACIGSRPAVVRCMPNTSCAVGESATAIAAGMYAGEEHLSAARKLFGALGEVVAVDESSMDLVTGLSGSGPAYFYYLVELMEKTAVAAGLSREVARKLLFQTIYGAAKMLRDTNEDPSLLRQRVTSPGGTTFAALEVLKNMGLEDAVNKAVLKAAVRSRELGVQSIRQG